uniref:SCP domain-containing protein n=1 Tax=Angiostrongylus cantonensis TaxID=6313 RepID=A0A0K0D7I7_ANGCA
MWNCNLERSAEAIVVSCPQNQPMTGSQNAVNYLSFGPGMPPSVPSSPIESAVLKWVEIGSEVWPTDNRFDGNPELRDFANLIRANSASVGCSMASCGNRASVACIFSQPSLVARGLTRNGEYANENAPKASRMDLLGYDCGAEQLALNHVKSCDRRLSPPASRPGHKENIHILETTATDALGALQNAVAMWNKELEANGVPSNLLLTPQILRRQQRTVTNVAKILWGTNKYVGCATQLCNGFYFTSCMYREP